MLIATLTMDHLIEPFSFTYKSTNRYVKLNFFNMKMKIMKVF